MKKKFSRKIIIIISILAVGGGYLAYRHYSKTGGETKYILAVVKKDTIISSISGTGQVSAENQADIKSKVSGDVVRVGVTSGQEVKAGALIAQIDARDAEIALENAKLSFQKLVQPADVASIIQAENSLEDAKQSNIQAKDNLVKSYDDGFNTVANAFLDLPDIISGLNDLLNSYQSGNGYLNEANARNYGDTAVSYREGASKAYFDLKNKYDLNLAHYKNSARTSSASILESLISETYLTAKAMADTVKKAKDAVDFIKSQQSSLSAKNDSTAVLSNLNSWTSKINTDLSSLLSIKNNIDNSKNAILSSSRDISQKTESLRKLREGADPLDVKAQELAVLQKQYSYEDYFIKAQFDGIIGKLNVKNTDSISSGSVIGTLITKQKVADISLNEIDASQVKVGQKVTLAFDAVDGLSLTGKVIETDLVGTVNQGVVTYNIKIGFDAQDDRVKPGMSANASIITEVKPDALTVPNSAVKSQGNNRYVEVFDQKFPQDQNAKGVSSPTPPRQQPVEIGISSDTMTEIISGLNEGDVVVSRTIQSGATTAQTSQQSGGGFRIPGLPNARGGR